MRCLICGAADAACGGPSHSQPVDLEATDMPLTMPPRKRPETEPREMVRVQLKPNDIRSYERSDAEAMLAQAPGAYILGEQGDPSMDAETKTQRSAPNKARTTRSAPKPADSPPDGGQAETKPAETKAE